MAVVGDGAVGLCGVIAARRLGAEQIIILGRHPDRIALAQEFGATDVVSERGDEAVERVRELTGGFGAHSVLECVGHGQSTVTALGIARPGGAVGRVGVPQDETIPARSRAFFDNITITGGPAPARAYIEELLPDVLEGRIEPGRVFDRVGRARRGARRLPGDERPRSDQGPDRGLSHGRLDTRASSRGSPPRTSCRSRTVRGDGTLRAPVTIWVVRLGDDLYVRSSTGGTRRGSAAHGPPRGHIRAGGVDKDVSLVETDDLGEDIDAAYRTKYRRYAAGIVDTVLSPDARTATLRLAPR